jgi:hypothetical protein
MRTLRLFCCLVLAATPALAGPAALVTDVSGAVSPPVGLFHEVDAGTELTVERGASLTIEHYASCEAATVTGGPVVVAEWGLDLGRADVAERAEVDCPAAIALRTGEMIGAGIVLRGANQPRIPLAPEIVIAEGGTGFESMRIERGGDPVRTLPVRAGRVEWPAGGLFLTDRATYVLVLSGPAGEHRARVVADREANGLTVLRP